nr:unnamed protein product [Callosobruchus chinensis]
MEEFTIDGAAHLAGAAALAALLKPFLLTPLAAAAPALFAAPKLPVAGAALPLASPGLLSAAAATAPAALTGATFPLLLAAPWLNAVFTLVAPALFAGPALTAPAAIAALSVAPFVKTAITAPLLPAADPLSAALRDILVLTYNIGFFAPSILFAALPILIPVIQKELWAGPLVAFLTSTLFPVAAKTAACPLTLPVAIRRCRFGMDNWNLATSSLDRSSLAIEQPEVLFHTALKASWIRSVKSLIIAPEGK